jgi:hypothetical protein
MRWRRKPLWRKGFCQAVADAFRYILRRNYDFLELRAFFFTPLAFAPQWLPFTPAAV